MSSSLILKLDILLIAQRELWAELNQIPNYFTLYGGTAIGPIGMLCLNSLSFPRCPLERLTKDVQYSLLYPFKLPPNISKLGQHPIRLRRLWSTLWQHHIFVNA